MVDEKELYEEANVEEIMMSYFKEKFCETSDFTDIVHNNYFSQAKSKLSDICTDFLVMSFPFRQSVRTCSIF